MQQFEPAMTSPLTLGNLGHAKPGVGVLTVLEGGEQVFQPLADGREVVLNLTPNADDWLEVVDANDKVYDHAFSDKGHGPDKIGAQALHMGVRLPLLPFHSVTAGVDRRFRKEDQEGRRLQRREIYRRLRRRQDVD